MAKWMCKEFVKMRKVSARSSYSSRCQLDTTVVASQEFGVVICTPGRGKLPEADKQASAAYMKVSLAHFGGNEAVFQQLHACFSKFMGNKHYVRSGFITGSREAFCLSTFVLQ